MENKETFETMIKDVINKDFATFKDKLETEVKNRLETKLKDKLSEIEKNLFSGNTGDNNE